ncbi:hypothetical protein [Pseudobacteriovorax antillogorgiicola]|uniref:Uncharacterized protein n=1 Tax=Pseudobacteriovorax antillogorgiicola TaxID=1513793 RepID=A0A1Y6BF10_9BACT|nr:hypothetical protein [Pseudobacteriovorax antillogorgiicola]TCS56260.1 hypothetical protein EDD56_10482 [Pseudobacteriovorax antillogorgiicola]SMF07883.1 hypothetical protein SAMN06296036_104251 [Pseudobacteriovorax antillogorgiicola]
MKHKAGVIALLGFGLIAIAFYLSQKIVQQKSPAEQQLHRENEEAVSTAPVSVEVEEVRSIEPTEDLENESARIQETWASIPTMDTEELKEELQSHEEEIERDDVIKRLNLDGEVASKEREYYGRKFKRMSDLRVAITNRDLEGIKADLAAHKLKLQNQNED